jgi:TrmH family RNA methyltransferase
MPAHPVRFVLVATSHPGNIGASARAMKTMAIEELTLVAPLAFPSAEATSLASGADELLARARVVDSVSAAVADCGLVLGTTSRERAKFRWTSLSARAAAERAASELATAPVAVLFGPERTGLSNEELELCHALVHIPANPEYGSLNLAQAVQVIAYELFLARDGASLPAREIALASAGELERLYVHLAAVLEEVDFADRQGGEHLERRLKRIIARAELDAGEVSILRGFLTAVQGKRRRAGALD